MRPTWPHLHFRQRVVLGMESEIPPAVQVINLQVMKLHGVSAWLLDRCMVGSAAQAPQSAWHGMPCRPMPARCMSCPAMPARSHSASCPPLLHTVSWSAAFAPQPYTPAPCHSSKLMHPAAAHVGPDRLKWQPSSRVVGNNCLHLPHRFVAISEMMDGKRANWVACRRARFRQALPPGSAHSQHTPSQLDSLALVPAQGPVGHEGGAANDLGQLVQHCTAGGGW